MFSTHIQKAETPEEMRMEILRLCLEDPMVRQVLDLAAYNGLSGEDKYTCLSYHLLCQNYRLNRLLLEAVNANPNLIFNTEENNQ